MMDAETKSVLLRGAVDLAIECLLPIVRAAKQSKRDDLAESLAGIVHGLSKVQRATSDHHKYRA